ncbi:hypothetical protein JCGZ_03179 [Jatropha curcas]|uniref:ADP-ribosyl cyclase/cyclic ADP-ribose hydrolase n=1 Tax=Jatropha curcas TaxID=180498 RepID=A0A067L1F7_JATCU|nr:disease resistance protein RPV1 isoform X2 [Jatropha curcas]KDP41073.1 hypothetical protein JCGZ_03179 [Jatropha curcas]
MASTSSTAVRRKCDVFLNFRGGDTCENFVSELCKTLNRNLIETFIIDDKFGGRGGEEEILRKIQEADISSVIFSEDYASSALCMDELLKIVECKETKGQTVIPVFYRVDPTHVQHLKGNFGFGFDKLTQELRNSLPKVESWRSALIKTAYLKGWDSHFTKPESKLIHEIVNDILKKLNQVFFNGSVLVGISSHIREVESLLSIESQGVRSIGIWGMGGIGKTTITEVLFSRISAQFECQCYVPNVREQLEKRTVAHIRAEILSKLLGMENSIVRMPYIFPNFIRNKLRKKKVLIVLDDVDNSEVVRDLVGDCHLYGSGSRIIVTSRDKQVLKNADIKEYIYEVEKLVDFQAILLFSLHAFKQDAPPEEFMKLSERAITYAQGIPLAIKILGSSLYCKSVNEWESELAKLENSPDRTIEEVLKISYDGLESSEQSIFLDIACFFKGEDRTRIQSILNGCGFFADIGISRLLDKSLITISSNNQLEMHDLLQQMGRNIVCLECIHQPGERSRLWIPQDVYLVLKREKGTGNIEGISLDKSKIRDIELSPTVFERMYNLRLLEFHNPFTSELKIYLPKGLQFLPDELRFLRWDKYPSKSLPTSFCAEKLMELHMRESQLRELWNGVQSRYIGAKMYIAGSEMAENIRYHTNNGSSLSFTIDQQQPDLIGFSLCAVVASNGHPPPHDVINIRCRALLTGESGHSHIEDLYFFSYPDELDIQSETLFLWANSISWDSEDGLSKASFHFFMDYHNEEDEDYYECKEVIVRCGVHPIFKDKKSKNKDENEESQQPPLKRLKEEHLSAVSWMTTD